VRFITLLLAVIGEKTSMRTTETENCFSMSSGRSSTAVERCQYTKSPKKSACTAFEAIAQAHESRNHTIVAAHATGAYSYQQVAEFFSLHFTPIGKIVRAAKATNRMQ